MTIDVESYLSTIVESIEAIENELQGLRALVSTLEEFYEASDK